MNDEYKEYKRKMAEIGTPYYRFSNGVFVEAETFELAKKILIARIEDEKEEDKRWHACTCLGLSHRHNCPVQHAIGVPF